LNERSEASGKAGTQKRELEGTKPGSYWSLLSSVLKKGCNASGDF